jgi:hypothetical protein
LLSRLLRRRSSIAAPRSCTWRPARACRPIMQSRIAPPFPAHWRVRRGKRMNGWPKLRWQMHFTLVRGAVCRVCSPLQRQPQWNFARIILLALAKARSLSTAMRKSWGRVQPS